MDDCDSCFSTRPIVTTTLDHCSWAVALGVQVRAELHVCLQRGGHLPSETWSQRCSPLMMLFLGWLTSQLTRRRFISFLGINVCLCISSKDLQGDMWGNCGWKWSHSSGRSSSSSCSSRRKLQLTPLSAKWPSKGREETEPQPHLWYLCEFSSQSADTRVLSGSLAESWQSEFHPERRVPTGGGE